MTYGKHRSIEEYPTGKAYGSHQFSIISTLRLVQNSGINVSVRLKDIDAPLPMNTKFAEQDTYIATSKLTGREPGNRIFQKSNT